MSDRLASHGVMLAYCCESVAGTMPTSGYVVVPEIKAIPSFNPQPDALQSTALSETEFHTYVEGLRDIGGALEFTANLTEDLISAWDTVNSAHDALTGGKAMWFAVIHPKLANAVFFKGDPTPLGLNEISVNTVLETTLYITPNSAPTWSAKPSVVESGNVNLGTLQIGTNVLTPFFNAGITSYTMTTTNATDKLVAVAEDNSATVLASATSATISEDTISWSTNPNVISVKVTNGGAEKTYVVTVTKS